MNNDSEWLSAQYFLVWHLGLSRVQAIQVLTELDHSAVAKLAREGTRQYRVTIIKALAAYVEKEHEK